MARSGRRLMGEINVVPYIDVMLVLLIIFMITAPLLTQGIEVDLPDAAAEPLDAELLRETEPLILTVTVNGDMYLNIGDDEDKPVDDQQIVARARAVMRRNPATPMLVRADNAVPYGKVVAGMVLLQAAGARKVGFVTEPPEPVE
ncbi:MAG: protein TolR [Gammaproteobacteria bacterium]|nr:protein TolR [Gammaproteobacteria bacterium]NND59203.1 protein TolR [Gammaproteobacteria bacterium]